MKLLLTDFGLKMKLVFVFGSYGPKGLENPALFYKFYSSLSPNMIYDLFLEWTGLYSTYELFLFYLGGCFISTNELFLFDLGEYIIYD